ncbi:MAG: hypothetical protein KJO12_00875 [Ignavibacteria bacterium]|nr:hypothetical protein [Ignavibacteria bacterium]
MKQKIGVGVVTFNRPKYFKECIHSIPEVDTLVVVNDGSVYPDNIYPTNIKKLIEHKASKGVGAAKNQAIKYLMKEGCDHIFLCEDDIKITNQNILEKYIIARDVTGISHFNFGYHGPLNKDRNGIPLPKYIMNYDNDVSIALNFHICGAFSYYQRKVIERVGLLDERFKNAYEHIDHTYQIIKAGYHPPFGWFADIADSHNFIKDLDPHLAQSVIRKNGLSFYIRYKYYRYLFKRKNGVYVIDIPKIEEKEVLEFLDFLRKKNRLTDFH